MTGALHSSASSEWHTPADVLARVRAALGGTINLDPASSWEANQVVGAEGIFTRDVDGLAMPWHGPNVYLNAPGGKGLPKAFLEKLHTEMGEGRVERAVYMAFSLEQLASLDFGKNYVVCIPRKRIKFIPGDGSKATSPTHSNAIVGLNVDRESFASAFSDYGKILCEFSF